MFSVQSYLMFTILISTNEFKYDEEKTWELEKKLSLRRVLFKYLCQILQNYLYRVKSLYWKSPERFVDNYLVRKCGQKMNVNYINLCCIRKWHRKGITFFLTCDNWCYIFENFVSFNAMLCSLYIEWSHCNIDNERLSPRIKRIINIKTFLKS